MNEPIRPLNQIPEFGRVTILIVEDNPDHLFLIKSALEQCMPGVNAIGAVDRETAITYLETSWGTPKAVPNLVLLDLYLPGRAEGLAAMKEFKDFFQSHRQPPVPVVIFSSSTAEEDSTACYDLGANAYMVKSPDFKDWLRYFDTLRQYWLQTVTLPPFTR